MPSSYNVEEQRQAKVDALREAIREGVESGHGIACDEVFDRLKAKYTEAKVRNDQEMTWDYRGNP
jgi:hypothetical protein